MTSKTARALATLALSGIGFLAAGCGPKAIPIGAVLPLTGPDHVYGEPVRRGLELAYEEIQADADSGVQIALTVVDSESKPEKAKELLEQQFDQGALLALGGVTTAEAKEMIAVAEEYDRVLISPTASAPELSGLSRNFYRIWPSDLAAAGRMAQFVSQDLKIDEVVVIAEERQEYAQGIQSAFKSAYEGYGGTVVEEIPFPPYTSDFSGLIDRVMTLQPGAVYLTAYGEAIGQMIQELRARKYDGKILTTHAFASPRFIAPVGDAAKGVILTQTVFEPDSEYAHVKGFVTKFQEKYDEVPDIFAAHGYDLLKIVAAALANRPALPSEVPKGLRDVDDFPGVTGSISFNEKGDVLKYPRVYIITNELILSDYTERARAQQAETRQRMEEIKRKLEELSKKAKKIGN